MPLDPARRAFIASIPKTETHLHVEGSVPYELLRAGDPGRYPADPPFRRSDYRYASFPAFEQILLDHALPWFTSAERYHEAAKAIFAGKAADNARYVETSFHLAVTQLIGVPGPEIVAAIRSAAPAGMEVRVFAGMLRSDYHGPLGRRSRPCGTGTGWPGWTCTGLSGCRPRPGRRGSGRARARRARSPSATPGNSTGPRGCARRSRSSGSPGCSTACARSRIRRSSRWRATAG